VAAIKGRTVNLRERRVGMPSESGAAELTSALYHTVDVLGFPLDQQAQVSQIQQQTHAYVFAARHV
jgi:hypothetical protein